MKLYMKSMLIVLLFIFNTAIIDATKIKKGGFKNFLQRAAMKEFDFSALKVSVQKIKLVLEDMMPAKIFFSVGLGLLSVYSEPIKTVYDILITYYDYFNDCASSAKTLWDKFRSKKADKKQKETKVKLASLDSKIPDFDNPKENHKSCLNFKSSIQKKFNITLLYLLKCDTLWPYMKDLGYGDSLNEDDKAAFLNLCNTYKDINCDELKQKRSKLQVFSSGLKIFTDFFKNIKNFLDTISSFKGCFDAAKLAAGKVKSLLSQEVKNYILEIGKSLFKKLGFSVVGKFINSFTVGIWGDLKASFMAYKFVRELKRFYDEFGKKVSEIADTIKNSKFTPDYVSDVITEKGFFGKYSAISSHLYFKLGRLIGWCIRTISALFG